MSDKPFRWNKYRKALRTMILNVGVEETKSYVKDTVLSIHSEARESEQVMAIMAAHKEVDEVAKRMGLVK